MFEINEDFYTLLKEFIKIDEDLGDDLTLSSLILMAEEYLKNGIGYPITYANKLEELAVILYVVHLYENRTVVTEKATKELPHSLSSIIQQLKYCYGS